MKIEDFFKEIKQEEPTPDFMEKLMFRLEKEVRKERRKKQWLTFVEMAAGIIGILLTPCIVLYLCSYISLPLLKKIFTFDPLLLTVGFSVLLLLIADSLFRKKLSGR
ncbi:hypothetical protein AGMMS50262_08210 [Bacteroidia bacterium]|nr:hypothetical protein AGMMS50262_08210 [Bacteroidia bacterium]